MDKYAIITQKEVFTEQFRTFDPYPPTRTKSRKKDFWLRSAKAVSWVLNMIMTMANGDDDDIGGNASSVT